MGKSVPHTVYTTEMDEWLKEHYQKLSGKELLKAFNERFGTCTTFGGLKQHANHWLGLSKDGIHRFTEEELQFVDGLIGEYTWKEIHRMFNDRFENKASFHSIKNAGRRYRIQHDVVPGVRFTKEQEEWLKENVPGSPSWNDVARRFSETFGIVKGQYALRSKVRSMEGVYINGGQTGYHAGNVLWNLQPDGTERQRSNGYMYVKIGDEWIPKQKVMYEKAHGPLPDGWFVIFLDGNMQNYAPDNLYAVDRVIHARMCQNGWYSDDPEITRAAVKLCELDGLLKHPKRKGIMKNVLQ